MTKSTNLNRNSLLITRSFRRYLLPGIMMMVSLQLGNVVDMILVGSILGDRALTAIQLLIPIISMSQICGTLLGVGGSVLAGEYMGKRDTRSANAVYTLVLSICMVVSVSVCVLLFIFRYPLTLLLAGHTGLESYMVQYLVFFLPCIILINCLYPVCLFLNVEGHPEVASKYLAMSNVVNLVADFIILKYTPIGIGGAALSTMLGYVVCLLFFFPKFFSKKNILRYDVKQFRVRDGMEHLKKICLIGSSSLATLLTVPVASLAINQMVVVYVGADALIAYTVCTNVLMLAELIVGGVKQTIPSLVPILNGEKDYYGIRSLLKRVLFGSVVLLVVLIIILFTYTEFFAKLYGVSTVEAMEATKWAIRAYAIALPFIMYNRTMNVYYQSIQAQLLSVFCTVLEELVFVVPAAFIMVKFWGLKGIIFAMILSPILASFSTFVFRKVKYGWSKDKSLLPVCKDEAFIEFSIGNRVEDAVIITERISDFCKDKGVALQTCNIVAMAAEEMAVNAIRNSMKLKRQIAIDVIITLTETSLLLSIRDDGSPFNPLEYEYDQSEEIITDGIKLIRKMTNDTSYLRVLDPDATTVAKVTSDMSYIRLMDCNSTTITMTRNL